jgi:hypothetical protein
MAKLREPPAHQVSLPQGRLIVGCRTETGSGLWHLSAGGDAKLISSDSSDVTLERLGTPTPGKTGRRPPDASKVEQVELPAGAAVLVVAIDGDLARVEIKDGASTGSIYWVECSRLEAAPR